MNSSSKANGKAKHAPTSQYLLAPFVGPSRFGLPPVKPVEEVFQTAPAKEWSEWSQMEGISGARARLIADDWEGTSSKWTIRTSCE